MSRLPALALAGLLPLLAGDAPLVRGPSWIDGCLALYASFDGDAPAPDLDPGKLEVVAWPAAASAGVRRPGLFGQGLEIPGDRRLTLRGDVLSPHRPLTVSFWWSLPRDLPVDGSFSLFQLTGRGFISAFTRGKGEWCALRAPAGVLQVYNFPGIPNSNNIYDDRLAEHLDVRAGVWHHTAVVIRRAARVELYTDGRLVTAVDASGREFSAGDKVRTLDLGGGIILDELLVLDRAIDPGQVEDYFRGVSRLREYLSR